MPNYRPTNAVTDGSCKEFHPVDVKLYGSKDAFKDAFACGIAVKCRKCGMYATDIPQAGAAVFGAPPKWFLRVVRNASHELIVLDSKTKGV